jgi:hypothetical protein
MDSFSHDCEKTILDSFACSCTRFEAQNSEITHSFFIFLASDLLVRRLTSRANQDDENISGSTISDEPAEVFDYVKA